MSHKACVEEVQSCPQHFSLWQAYKTCALPPYATLIEKRTQAYYNSSFYREQTHGTYLRASARSAATSRFFSGRSRIELAVMSGAPISSKVAADAAAHIPALKVSFSEESRPSTLCRFKGERPGTSPYTTLPSLLSPFMACFWNLCELSSLDFAGPVLVPPWEWSWLIGPGR